MRTMAAFHKSVQVTSIPLLAAILCSPTYAVSFLSFDSRTMALGGSGTAAARPSEAVLYNPALLASDDRLGDNGFFVSSYVGARLHDQNSFIKKAEAFSDDHNEKDLDSSIDKMHTLFELGNLQSQNIRDVTVEISDIINDIEALSGHPLRAGISAGINTGWHSKEWGFGISARQYRILGGQLRISPQDVIRIRQILSTADAVAGVLDKSNDLETLIEQTDYDDILSLIEEDARNGEISEELRNYRDIPKVADVIVAMEALQFEVEELANYIDMERLYDAISAQNTGLNLEDLGLEDVKLRDYLRYQIPEEFMSGVHFSGAEISEFALSVANQNLTYSRLSIGASMKYQLIDAIAFFQPIDDVDVSAYIEPQYRRRYERVNLDVGLAIQLTDRWRFGAVAKNLIPYSVAPPSGKDISISTLARIALSYQKPGFLWTLDFDLTQNEPLGFDPDKQYLSNGLAIHLWKTGILRTGYRVNTVDGIGVYSLGLGIGGHTKHIDFAITGSDAYDELGLSLQLGAKL